MHGNHDYTGSVDVVVKRYNAELGVHEVLGRRWRRSARGCPRSVHGSLPVLRQRPWRSVVIYASSSANVEPK